jgi:molybdate transport system substrate-binding protein
MHGSAQNQTFMSVKMLLIRLLSCGLSLWFSATSAVAGEVNVYAAASLTDAINELASAYEKQHPTLKIKPVYASSSALAKQIEKGAPADLFMSADADWADYLDKRNLFLAGSRRDLLGNQLVLITPAGKEFAIKMDRAFNLPASYAGKLCTGEPAYVPVGKYAQQALSYYGWWDAIKPRLVGTDDVRTATAFVERGECALGIVYSTDAKIAKKASVIASFPSASHKPIIYPGALLKAASPDSQGFWAYLQGDEARAVFVRYGFSVLNDKK